MDHGGSAPNGNGRKVLLLAARQPDLRGLLEEAGFTVEAERQPPKNGVPDVDLAVVFRGRLIGRNQAATLHARILRAIAVSDSQNAVRYSDELVDFLEEFTRFTVQEQRRDHR